MPRGAMLITGPPESPPAGIPDTFSMQKSGPPGAVALATGVVRPYDPQVQDCLSTGDWQVFSSPVQVAPTPYCHHDLAGVEPGSGQRRRADPHRRRP